MNRKDFIRTITYQLKDADLEALRLIWIATRDLARKGGQRAMTEPTNRVELTAAIVALLDKADFRKLRLVWIYTSHLIDCKGGAH